MHYDAVCKSQFEASHESLSAVIDQYTYAIFEVCTFGLPEICVFDVISNIFYKSVAISNRFFEILRLYSKVVMGNFLSDAEGGMKLRGA